MKKTRILSAILACVIAMAISCAPALAAEPASASPAVRVNGSIVEFPDGQPYIDENNRTLIPVRFVTEELGAKVSWSGMTVSIAKDGTTVNIVIGSPDLKVTANGKTTTVTMDTAAVLKDYRTYVPIRYVAEALGAFVDYSSTPAAVCIYDDVLTPEQIVRLQSYPYTLLDGASPLERYKANHSAEDVEYCYGNRDGFGLFANAREFLYHTVARIVPYNVPALGKTVNPGNADTFYDLVTKEAAAEVGYSSERLTVSFLTDESTLYQPDDVSCITCTVRGIACVRLHVKPQELTGPETVLLCNLGFTQLYQDKDMYIDVDVHMNTSSKYPVNINNIVPLSDAYYEMR